MRVFVIAAPACVSVLVVLKDQTVHAQAVQTNAATMGFARV
jgi:hypothetical protein